MSPSFIDALEAAQRLIVAQALALRGRYDEADDDWNAVLADYLDGDDDEENDERAGLLVAALAYRAAVLLRKYYDEERLPLGRRDSESVMSIAVGRGAF